MYHKNYDAKKSQIFIKNRFKKRAKWNKIVQNAGKNVKTT